MITILKYRPSSTIKNKFTKLNHNPTNQLKSKINKLINANNADLRNIKLPKIISDYIQDCIYKTVKRHKPLLKNSLHMQATLMIANGRSERARENFVKFIH